MDNEQILKEPPVAGTEVDTLIGSLERQRRTFAWKCGDLDSAGLQATTAATTMTLGGLLKHLALVEADYFAVKLLGQRPRPAMELGGLGRRPELGVADRGRGHSRRSSTRCGRTAWPGPAANLAEALADGDPGRPASSPGPTVGHRASAVS